MDGGLGGAVEGDTMMMEPEGSSTKQLSSASLSAPCLLPVDKKAEEEEGGEESSCCPVEEEEDDDDDEDGDSEEEERMAEDMIRMIEKDEVDEEEREQKKEVVGTGKRQAVAPTGRRTTGGKQQQQQQGGVSSSPPPVPGRGGLDTGAYADAVEEEEDDEDAREDFLRSLIVRLMLHSADSGRDFDPSLGRDLQYFIGSNLYSQIQEHCHQQQQQQQKRPSNAGEKKEERRGSCDGEHDLMHDPQGEEDHMLLPSQLAHSLAGLQLKSTAAAAPPSCPAGTEQKTKEEKEQQQQQPQSTQAAPSQQQLQRQPPPHVVRLADVELEMQGDSVHASTTSSRRSSRTFTLTPRGSSSDVRRGFGAAATGDGDDEEEDDNGDEEEEEEDVDEWENDRDCGYVGFPISEQEFYDLEEEAMEAAHRAMVAAKAARQVSAWGGEEEGEEEEEGSDDDDDDDDDDDAAIEADLLEAEQLLRERELIKLKQALLNSEAAMAAASGGPPVEEKAAEATTTTEKEVAMMMAAPVGGISLLKDEGEAALPAVDLGAGGEINISALDSNSQNLEAPVWPRHADDFAFSQAGDEEDEQSLSIQGGRKEGEEEEEDGGVSMGDLALLDSREDDEDDEGEGDGKGKTKVGSLAPSAASAGVSRRVVDDTVKEEEDDDDDDDEEEDEVLESFNLKVIYEKNRTGFEDTKDFQPAMESLVAGRYRVKNILGSAVFSTAIECEDLMADHERVQGPKHVCLKIIKNNKDFFDQSLDEIKLLQLLKESGDPDKYHFLRMWDYFYYKEHLIIVSELLKDNLYEYGKYLRDTGGEPYFTLPNLKRIMRQCLEALVFIHSLKLIHCDIKPENIVIRSYSRVEVKLIDFGSSCFTTDNLTTYIQSRSYRAPEVILGLPYGRKIDVWSLGCVLAELYTGYVLFQNDSIQSLLARMMGILGPIPEDLLLFGREVPKYFTSSHILYERQADDPDGSVLLLYPKKTNLAHRLHTDDQAFLDFTASMLQIHPDKRPTAQEALRHPWLVD